MNNIQPDEFYRKQLVPFWERHSVVKKECLESAEKIFWDLLKLTITLSTGMMAFLVTMSRGVEIGYLIKFILLFLAAIISAIFSFVNSAFEYKKESDYESKLLHEIAKKYTNGNIEDTKRLLKEAEEKPLSQGYNDWHLKTIRLGALSLLCFLIGTVWFVIFLLTTSTLCRAHV